MGWLFDQLQVIALTASFAAEPDASINGSPVPQSGRRLTTVGLFGALPLPSDFRLTGAVGFDLPISGLGQGQGAGLFLNVSLLKLW